MNDLPQIWVDPKRDNSKFSGKTDKGEFYAFQLGILAKDSELKNVKIIATDLVSSAGKISASLLLPSIQMVPAMKENPEVCCKCSAGKYSVHLVRIRYSYRCSCRDLQSRCNY